MPYRRAIRHQIQSSSRQASRSAAFCRSVIYSLADFLSRSVFEKEFPCLWTVTYD
jgi:hypothetical protein